MAVISVEYRHALIEIDRNDAIGREEQRDIVQEDGLEYSAHCLFAGQMRVHLMTYEKVYASYPSRLAADRIMRSSVSRLMSRPSRVERARRRWR